MLSSIRARSASSTSAHAEPVPDLSVGGAVLVDVLQRLAHLTGSRGQQTLSYQAVLGLGLPCGGYRRFRTIPQILYNNDVCCL